MTLFELLKRPSAVLPVAVSVAAILTIVAHIARFGTAPQPDEGAAAHIWQLLMLSQVPLVAFFALRWVPRVPRQAFIVLAIQAVSIVAALAPVALLHW